MAAPGVLDPTKPGQYPVILSDELMGKTSKETYTGIRYNHRPTLSSETAPNTARLKKSAKDDSFNLGFDDQGDKYQYNGVRTTKDGNFVLIFDPARKVFVLHRVDSTFHMNITRTPTDSNVESLRNQFPHLEVKPASTPRLPKKKGANKAGSGPGPGPNPSASSSKPPTTKPKDAKLEDTPKKKNKTVELTLPDLTLPTVTLPAKPAPLAAESVPEKKSKRRALSPVESEEEDDDDDGGLTIEYPDANPNAFRSASQYPPTIPAVTRRFSEFARDIERESDEDEFATGTTDRHYGAAPVAESRYDDDEYEDEEEEDGILVQPPNPTRTEPPVAVEPDRYTFDDDDDDDAAANDALDQEFEQLAKELDKVEDEGNDSDSSVSEEE
ncbi:RNA polymerase II transcription elongation factor-domain-containing protein [Staphylotrichum tortipilum]|uniref:RNA polymerase II transcription elongation factor-domain-containing protein n=1 Tax=Staphylotrichum tortipilum TaxID=2831512 RepID=A0AAN6MQI1_9PEZI|nr:RNA polymerase II transcription elongation factor-domain-containing protein [Staphylotrichum longicolle]